MQEATCKMKADSYKMAGLSPEVRNNILANVKEALIDSSEKIFAAKKKTLRQQMKMELPSQLRKDLSLMNINFLMLQKELMNLLSYLTL